MGRISVIRNDKVVPLIPGSPLRSSRFSPWRGLLIEQHQMTAMEIPEHEHAAFCLHMQTSGPAEMEWWSEGRNGTAKVGPGSLIYVAPGTQDRVRWDRATERLVVSLDESYLSRAARELGQAERLRFENRWAFRDPQLHLLLLEMQREMEANWATGPLYGDLLAMSLSVALVKKYAGSGAADGVGPGVGNGIGQEVPGHGLRHVLDYIHENSHEELRLEELAQIARMSVFHFARRFRAQVGVSPHRYVMEQRVQRAKDLLGLGSRTVAEVAAESGFSNAHHFARAFRRHTGMSPTEWARLR
jgi:AraC family transcriptional regulator